MTTRPIAIRRGLLRRGSFRRGLVLIGGLAVALSSASSIAASDPSAAAAGCAAQFEIAQKTDMESFRDFDEATWLAGHHPDAITVFASGAVRYGLESIAATLHNHFVNRNAVWSWTELSRVVDGCRAAFILYDAHYDIPSIAFKQHTLTSVTYTHVGDRWLSIGDQGTLLP